MTAVRTGRAAIDGVDFFIREAGDARKPAVLLLHGFPTSSAMFAGLMERLAGDARLIAPDLPGFGFTEFAGEWPDYGFVAIADKVRLLLDRLGVESFFLYLHDFGAPVGFHLALDEPARIRGLIIQNANAHISGFGPQWADTRAHWADPQDARLAARAAAHLTFEGTRDQYIGGVPDRLKPRFDPERWREDWARMSEPGRIDLQRRLILDYGRYVRRFPDIEAYLRANQPPSILLWGRHDAFFEMAEIMSYLADLEALDMHVFDGAHLLLETHADPCAQLIAAFLRRQERAASS